jgi:hypothetical protein
METKFFSQAKNYFRERWFLFVFLGLLLLFTVLVFYGFPDSPSPWFDEGVILGVAKSYVQDGVYDFKTGPGQYTGKPYLLITSNYPLLFFIGTIFELLGIGLWQAKIVMIIFLFVFFALFYLIIKKYYGRNFALMGLALVITFLPLYGNGKNALGEIPGLVYFFGGLLLLDKRKWWQLFLAGILFGLGAATKSLYMLFVPALLGGEIWLAIKSKNIEWKRWAWLAAGGLLPLCLWIWTILPAGLSWSSFSESAAYYKNPYNLVAQSVVFKNFLRFFTETTPLHFSLLFGVFAISKIIRRDFKQIEVVLFLFIVLDWLFYLKTAGWYRYFFPAHISLFILFPYAFGVIAQKFVPSKFQFRTGAILILAVFTFQFYHLLSNINQKLYYNPLPRMFAQRVNQIVPAEKDILVVHNPAVAFLLEGRVWQYLAVNPYLTAGRSWLGEGKFPDYVVMDKGNQVLLAEEDLAGKYEIVYQAGKAILWKKTDL